MASTEARHLCEIDYQQIHAPMCYEELGRLEESF